MMSPPDQTAQEPPGSSLHPVTATKQALRTTFLKARQALPPGQRRLASAQMWAHLLEEPRFQQARTLHLFLGTPHEPDTLSWIPELQRHGKALFAPRVLPGTPLLEHLRVSPETSLRPGAFGILEPEGLPEPPEVLQQLDLILIPGVAFDQRGNRLGYGKGYYDRFLSQSGALRLGVGFDLQQVAEVPTEPHDLPMHGLLSESGLTWWEAS